MKLYGSDDSDLMDVSKIYPEGANLVLEGVIMGAIPIRAVLKPAEMRGALAIMSRKTLWHAFLMLFKQSQSNR